MSDLTYDEEGFLRVYIDGFCILNGYAEARAGAGAFFGRNQPLNISKSLVGKSTSNKAEIQSAILAAQQGNRIGIKNLHVHTDSQFLINCVEKWIPVWEQRNWKPVRGKQVMNQDELIRLLKAYKTI